MSDLGAAKAALEAAKKKYHALFRSNAPQDAIHAAYEAFVAAQNAVRAMHERMASAKLTDAEACVRTVLAANNDLIDVTKVVGTYHSTSCPEDVQQTERLTKAFAAASDAFKRFQRANNAAVANPTDQKALAKLKRRKDAVMAAQKEIVDATKAACKEKEQGWFTTAYKQVFGAASATKKTLYIPRITFSKELKEMIDYCARSIWSLLEWIGNFIDETMRDFFSGVHGLGKGVGRFLADAAFDKEATPGDSTAWQFLRRSMALVMVTTVMATTRTMELAAFVVGDDTNLSASLERTYRFAQAVSLTSYLLPQDTNEFAAMILAFVLAAVPNLTVVLGAAVVKGRPPRRDGVVDYPRFRVSNAWLVVLIHQVTLTYIIRTAVLPAISATMKYGQQKFFPETNPVLPAADPMSIIEKVLMAPQDAKQRIVAFIQQGIQYFVGSERARPSLNISSFSRERATVMHRGLFVDAHVLNATCDASITFGSPWIGDEENLCNATIMSCVEQTLPLPKDFFGVGYADLKDSERELLEKIIAAFDDVSAGTEMDRRSLVAQLTKDKAFEAKFRALTPASKEMMKEWYNNFYQRGDDIQRALRWIDAAYNIMPASTLDGIRTFGAGAAVGTGTMLVWFGSLNPAVAALGIIGTLIGSLVIAPAELTAPTPPPPIISEARRPFRQRRRPTDAAERSVGR
jgi:hypothetical protein